MTAPSNTLSVPVRLQGLYLDQAQQVSAPSADYSQLPWYDPNAGTDRNFDHPFLSKNCLRQPFQTPETLLGQGVHLHFIIPHYLGRKVPDALPLLNAGKMPAAPNRWVISKIQNKNTVQQWYLESDYIHDITYRPLYYSCTIPHTDGQPYRHLGRQQVIQNNALPAPAAASQYFKGQSNGKPLTILGPGDVHFATFYPNCNTVFGFYDPSGVIDENTSYSVVGWHDTSDDDLLFQSITEWIQRQESIGATFSQEQLQQELQSNFGLAYTPVVSDKAVTEAPLSVFYGSFTFDQATATGNTSGVDVAIGSTGTEALSAYLANEIAKTDFSDTFGQSKIELENQLESALMFPKLDHHQVDVGAKFEEERHEAGFRPSHGGHTWKVQTEAQEKIPEGGSADSLPALPRGTGALLDALNKAQVAYHQAHQQVTMQQKQLYADWVKYMEARYPPEATTGNYVQADQIQYFLSKYSIDPLKQLMWTTGLLMYDQEEQWKPEVISNNPNDLANQVLACWTALASFLANENSNRAVANQPKLFINRIEGPRFWEVKAPVILFSGLDDSVATVNNSVAIQDNTLTTGSIGTSLAGILSALPSDNTFKSSAQSWTPFLMDWQFDLTQTNGLVNGSYDEHSLESLYDLDATSADFTLTNRKFNHAPSVFSGSIMLSSHTRGTYQTAIETFFTSFLSKNKITFIDNPGNSNNPYTITDFLQESDWSTALGYLKNPGIISSSPSPNPFHTLWKAYDKLTGQHFLSQTLDGFYEACVQLRKIPQFPIAEPIGFDYEQEFSALVNSMVQQQRHLSPEIAYDFNPIPSGNIVLNQVQLVDNFGLAQPVNTDKAIPFANPLCDKDDVPFLKPRIAQPARLNFQWLSAKHNNTPTNDDPVTSPICGWLMNNYLDNTLMIYEASGKALGSLDNDANWQVVPWNVGSAEMTDVITNPHLLAVVNQIKQSKDFLNNFITATQNAQHHIAPPNALLHSLKSDLIGKPIAVARVGIGLELQGLPHIDQSWSSLMLDLDNCDKYQTWGYGQRNKLNWTDINFPCRLGEHMQLNDGLIGYWMEQSDNTLGETYFAPQTEGATMVNNPSEASGNQPMIDQYAAGSFQDQPLKLNALQQNVTLLLDPHGPIHATTGILPTKAISIPIEHYLPALQKLKIWFRSSPVLQPKGLEKKVQIDLPKIPEMEWQWWDPYEGISTIEKYTENLTASSELKDGWLLLENIDK